MSPVAVTGRLFVLPKRNEIEIYKNIWFIDSLSNQLVIFVLFNVCSSNYYSLEHITVDAATAFSKPKPLSKFVSKSNTI